MEQEIKIGVYVCHCGLNISGIVNVKDVVEYANTLDSVVVSRDYQFMCSEPGQNLIKKDIAELGLNRVVVASCSPRMHEPTFRNACQQAGLNPYLMEMANIREHCSWVHDDKELATEKAKDLVKAAVRRVYYNQPLTIREIPFNSNTLVIGGGIAGIQASLDIANSEHKVYLVEKTPSIGGHMIQLDKTFPTLDCSACILTPKMASVGQHPYIDLLTYSEIVEVSGYVGNFKVKINKKSRYVDENKCTGCGLCFEKCPVSMSNEFELGLAERKAIYIPFPQAVPNKAVIDKSGCIECGSCQRRCEAKAIDFDMQDEIIDVEVGSIIVATGYDSFDPSVIGQYGYGKLDNVITGLEFERMSSATGPTSGNILLKNGQPPQSVAIVHCVGSRDQNYHDYCSKICCMYGLKFAHLIKEKTEAEVYEMYIDMRCFGKGGENFYKRLSEEGVNFIRGKVARISNRTETDEEKNKLIVITEDTLLGKMMRIPVDLVILCTAIESPSDTEKLGRLLTIGRSADGFFMERHVKLDPVATPNDGIFIVGCCQGPKDIPYTVAQASAGAAQALRMISKGQVEIEAAISVIDEKLCSGCKICNNLCPYNAISFNEEKGVSTINEALCKGCGTCGAACPSGAITSRHFTTAQLMAQLEGVLS
jgi:heterodisulfide reductase subunit A